jgi:hypothetical protein
LKLLCEIQNNGKSPINRASRYLFINTKLSFYAGLKPDLRCDQGIIQKGWIGTLPYIRYLSNMADFRWSPVLAARRKVVPPEQR